jgi:hypothetical protein
MTDRPLLDLLAVIHGERIAWREKTRTHDPNCEPPEDVLLVAAIERLRAANAELTAFRDRVRVAGDVTRDDVPLNELCEVWFIDDVGDCVKATIEGGDNETVHLAGHDALPALRLYSTESAARAAQERTA